MGRRDKSIDPENIDSLPVGLKLRLIRQSKRISLTQMAKLLNYSRSYLSTVENGSVAPSNDLIQRYEYHLGFAIGELNDLFSAKNLPMSKTSGSGQTKEMVHEQKMYPLIQARLRRGWAQADLAEKIGVASKTVARWETGRTTPQPFYRAKLGELLQIDPEELWPLHMNHSVLPNPVSQIGIPPSLNNLQKTPFDEALLLEPAHFVGREEDVIWLKEKIKSGGVTGIAALRGLGGIGKTSLAAIVARKLHQEGFFPGGIAVVLCQNLKNPAEVLRRVLSRFDPQYGEPETKNFADLSEMAYQLLHGKELLIILDNIQPGLAVEQVVAPLRNAGAALLLTSRHVLPYTAVPTNAIRKLGLLSSDEALELFAHSFGKENAEHLNALEFSTAERIIAALDRHTLAVKLSGIYAANLDRDLEALAEALENPQKVFELPENEVPQAVRQVFDHSLEILPQETQLLFSALAAFATSEFSRHAVIALAAGLSVSLPETSTNILILRSLVDAFVNNEMPRKVSDRERMRLHPLLRALAVAQFEEWPEARQDAASYAVAQYYSDYAKRFLKETFDSDEIIAALDPDAINITASLEWASAHGEDAIVMEICSVMQYIWSNQWNTDTSLRYLPLGIAAAERISEAAELSTERTKSLRYLSRLMLNYGNVLQLTSQAGANKSLEKAQRFFEKSLSIATKIQDREVIGVILYRLGRLFRKLGQLEKAETYYRRALPILRDLQNRRDEGWTLAFLGQIKHDQGDFEEAERLYKEALTIHQNIKFRRGEGWIIGYLGRVALSRHQQEARTSSLPRTGSSYLQEAEAYYLEYLEIANQQQDRLSKGSSLNFLGEIALLNKNYEKAKVYLNEAYKIIRDIHDDESEVWVRKLLRRLEMESETHH